MATVPHIVTERCPGCNGHGFGPILPSHEKINHNWRMVVFSGTIEPMFNMEALYCKFCNGHGYVRVRILRGRVR